MGRNAHNPGDTGVRKVEKRRCDANTNNAQSPKIQKAAQSYASTLPLRLLLLLSVSRFPSVSSLLRTGKGGDRLFPLVVSGAVQVDEAESRITKRLWMVQSLDSVMMEGWK